MPGVALTHPARLRVKSVVVAPRIIPIRDILEQHDGPDMDRFSVEFQKAGLRGISMLFAMGDGGVGGGIYPALTNCTVFIPAFPTSPWVTTVGGTDGYAPEAAWTGSSGGFSNWYPAPSYMTEAIQNYFTKYASSLPAAGLFNTTGEFISHRGFMNPPFSAVSFTPRLICLAFSFL